MIPIKISFCIPVTISSLISFFFIYHGTGCKRIDSIMEVFFSITAMRAEAPDSIRVSHSHALVGKGGTQKMKYSVSSRPAICTRTHPPLAHAVREKYLLIGFIWKTEKPQTLSLVELIHD